VPNVDVLTTILIARPREIVAEYAADPDHAAAWYENIKSVVWRTDKPLREGTRLTFHARFLGRTLDYTYEVSSYVPGLQLVMHTADGPFPMETTYQWDDAPNGQTRMTLRNQGAPSGFSSVVAPIMEPAMSRANRKDLRRLKALLEAGIDSTSPGGG
jgi:uncharacterized membrane protein